MDRSPLRRERLARSVTPVSMPAALHVRCPDCGSDLVIDASTGAVLSHRKAKQPIAGGKDFDSLLKGLDDDKNRAEDIFQREVSALKDRDRILEEKFREAMKRAEDSPDCPVCDVLRDGQRIGSIVDQEAP